MAQVSPEIQERIDNLKQQGFTRQQVLSAIDNISNLELRTNSEGGPLRGGPNTGLRLNPDVEAAVLAAFPEEELQGGRAVFEEPSVEVEIVNGVVRTDGQVGAGPVFEGIQKEEVFTGIDAENPVIGAGNQETFQLPPSETEQSFVLPDIGFNPKSLSDEAQVDLTRQASIAMEELGASFGDSEARFSVQANSNFNQIREEVSQAAVPAQEAQFRTGFSEQLRTQNVDVLADQILTFQERRAARKTALEEQYTNRINTGTLQDAAWKELDELNPGFREIQSARIRRGLILQNKIKEIESETENENWYWEDIPDFFSQVFGIEGIQTLEEYGSIFSGNVIRQVQEDLQTAKTDEEYLEALNFHAETLKGSQWLGDNPDWLLRIFGSVMSADDREILENNLLSGLDATFFALGAINLVTALRGVSKLGGVRGTAPSTSERITEQTSFKSDTSATASNAQDYEDLADEAVQGAAYKFFQSNEDLAENVLSLRTLEDKSSSILPEVQQRIDAIGRDLQNTARNFVAPTTQFKPNALDVAKAEFHNGSIRSARDTGEGFLEIDLMTTKGKPFTSEARAKTRANKLNLDGFEVVEEGGGYFIRGRVRTDIDGEAIGAQRGELGRIARWFGNIDSIIDREILQQAQLAEGAVSQIQSAVQRTWRQAFKPLSRKESEELDKILGAMRDKPQDQRRWLSSDEFVQEYRELTGGKLPSNQMLVANSAYRQLRDFQYFLDNRTLYDLKKGAGFDDVTLSDGTLFAGRLVQNPEGRILDSVTKTLVPIEELGDVDVYRIYNRDINSLSEQGFFKGEITDLVAVPKGSASVTDLNPKQLAYQAGGGRAYNPKSIWIKQPVVRTNADGTRVRLQDRTLAVSDNTAEAGNYINRYNRALKLAAPFIKGTSTRGTREVLEEFNSLDLGSFEDFLTNIRNNNIDVDVPVQALRNRERAIIRLPDGQALSGDFEDVVQTFNPNNRFLRRGEREVPHVNPENSQVLNPSETILRGLDTTARFASFSAFKENALQRFEDIYGEIIRKQNVLPANPNLIDYLNATTEGIEEGLARNIRSHQDYLKRIIGYRPPSARQWDNRVEKAFSWIFGTAPGNYAANRIGAARGITGQRAAEQVTERVVGVAARTLPEDQRISGVIKNLAFNAYLGAFSIPAFILQAQQSLIISAVAPRQGMTALKNYASFRMALLSSDPAVIAEMGKRLKNAGKEVEALGDFSEAVNEFRNLGIGHFGSNQILIDSTSSLNDLTKFSSNIASYGRFFFEEGEMIPRMTAYLIARQKWLAGETGDVVSKGISATTEEGRRWIRSETERLTLGMTRTDLQAAFTKPGVDVMLQFMSYPFRATAALTGMGSRAFSREERIRMATAYGVLYGAAGIPIVDTAVDYWRSKGADVDPTLMKGITSGMFDMMLYAASDGEIDTVFGERAGLGQFISDMITTFSDPNRGGSFLEVAAGPSGNLFSRSLSPITTLARTWSAMEAPGTSYEITTNVLGEIAKTVSTYNLATKAWLAFQTGKVFDRQGASFDISDGEIWSMIAGVPPSAYSDMSLLYASRTQKETVVKDLSDMAVKLYREINLAPPGDPSVEAKYTTLRALFDSAASDGFQDELIQNVKRSISSDDRLNRLIRDTQLRYLEGEAVPTDVIRRRQERENQDN